VTIANDITGGATPVFSADHRLRGDWEDPAFCVEKFPGASHTLTTSMKSVGEVMAIGRTFRRACS
jgi:carbamoyl-phosphate synthase large subunit